MRTRAIILLAPLLILAGCAAAPADESTAPEAGTPKPATVAPKPTTPQVVSEPEQVPAPVPAPVPESKDPARQATFLAILTEIDPGLTAKIDRALGRADNICMDISQGVDEATLLRNAEARYEGGTVPDVSPEQAQTILNAARDYYC